MAALLISEAKAEARQNNEQLYLATLDAQKAFDVVHHTILLDRLAELGIPSDVWLIIKDLYSDISSRVKWLCDSSDRFAVNQGVRQGGNSLNSSLQGLCKSSTRHSQRQEARIPSWNRVHRKPNSCRRCRLSLEASK